MEVNILKLRPEDWERFKEIRLKALQSDPLAFGSSYEEEVNRTEEVWRQKLGSSWAYAAVVSGKLIGMVRVVFEQGKHVRHVANVISLFVDPVYRGKGVGEMIMKKVLTDLHDNSVVIKINLSVNAKQETAINLFRRIGFTGSGVSKKGIKVNGVYYDQLHMELIFEDKI